MMIRDTRENRSYFLKYTEVQNERIEEFCRIKQQLHDDEKIAQCKLFLAALYRDLLTAEFSVGMDVEELRKVYLQYIECRKGADDISYTEYVDMLSLAIVLDTEFELLKECRIQLDEEDILIALLKRRIDGTARDNIIYENYYKEFVKYLLDEIDYESLIRYVENEWYESSKELSWYNAYERHNDTYVGYWCWLAAACLKIKGINPERGKSVFIPIL